MKEKVGLVQAEQYMNVMDLRLKPITTAHLLVDHALDKKIPAS